MLAHARRRGFVGRHGEVDLFGSLLTDPGRPRYAVLFVHGPGGIGKTALLGRFVDLAREAGVPTLRLDARTVEPSPPAFLAAVSAALGLPEDVSPLEALRTGGRRVVVLDTYEEAAALDEWLRERFLPELPTEVLTVIAGRDGPNAEWVADPGWRDVVRVLPLGNLGPEDVRTYLLDHGVVDALGGRVLEVTHGHPLALALLVDVLAQGSPDDGVLELVHSPALVRVLLQRFVRGVPSARHRDALQVCAHARFTTEDLLEDALGGDTSDIFAWLRTLSFVEEGRLGVFPHDLARDVLDADLRWRDPHRYAELHRRIRAHIVHRVQHTSGLDQQGACTDVLFLHRTNPRIRPYLDWTSLGRAYDDWLRPGDRHAILAMAAHHEGDESAALVAHWMDRQPEAFAVFRASDEEPIGFTAVLALHRAGDDDVAVDPGVRAMWEYGLSQGAPAAEEDVVAFRFFMDREAYQRPSPSFNLWAARGIQHIITARQLAWSFVAFAEPESVSPMFADIDYHRAPEADFLVGGRRYGVFAHDFRRVPPEVWLELTAQREISAESSLPAASVPDGFVVLPQREFADAVRRALRDLHHPDRLATNPLLRARLVRGVDGAESDPVQALVTVVTEAAMALRSHPREEKLYRALDRTYLRPAETQERAAEVLDLPFSTYRRHLTRGVERVTALLWQREHGRGG